jgi:hypothetical protein
MSMSDQGVRLLTVGAGNYGDILLA